ncbi:MAG: PCP reductase family protein [Planctomycetes bacterium]|nr:PCP reductase family protein [Planctomycetota bacterium]
MRFLCVPCDEPMRLERSEGPEAGSITAVFACPRCGHAVAMLTNPMETQVVRSMNVRIGRPETSAAGGADGGADGAGPPSFTREALASVSAAAVTQARVSEGAPPEGSRCPFAARFAPAAETESAGVPAPEVASALPSPDRVNTRVAPIAPAPADPVATAAPVSTVAPVSPAAARPAPLAPGTPVTWSPEADERLRRIPSFVRSMAAKAIEEFARKRGAAVVTSAIMDDVKQAYGM